MDKPNYNKLIPELAEWQEVNGADFSADDWICGIGRFDHAIGYLTVFWPSLYEHDGCIFVGGKPDEENYQSWLKSTEGNKKSVEAVLNHVHIIDLFQGNDTPPTEEQIIYIGNVLKDIWSYKAKVEFPERDISIEFYEGTKDDLVEYQVTLFQNEFKS